MKLPGVFDGFSVSYLLPNEYAGWCSELNFSGLYDPGAKIIIMFIICDV